ncbi:hypothetical protein [Amycolatopsis tolypomycina]|uniref:hypothetical protein n=1 Tax=Amycolatopsis tolypomycina TaxID=208445 RepID=UPI0033BDABE6
MADFAEVHGELADGRRFVGRIDLRPGRALLARLEAEAAGMVVTPPDPSGRIVDGGEVLPFRADDFDSQPPVAFLDATGDPEVEAEREARARWEAEGYEAMFEPDPDLGVDLDDEDQDDEDQDDDEDDDGEWPDDVTEGE